jgi:isopentenyl-diphosphate Delta-isomerase
VVADELIEVLTPAGEPTGEIKGKKRVHADGDYHACVHFFVTDGRGNLLTQFRGPQCGHMRNARDPIGWAGHMSARVPATLGNEPPLDIILHAFDTGIREGNEEGGVTGLTRDIIHTPLCRYIGVTRGDFTTEDGWQDRSFSHNFLLMLPDLDPATMPLEEGKVLDFKWMSIADILALLDGAHGEKLAQREPDHQWMIRLACAAALLMQQGH